MENTPRALGPRAADDTGTSPALSPQRAQLLQELRRSGPHTVATLSASTGLHVNTVREHLEGLSEASLVTRERLPSSGRGRPAWRFAARALPGATAVRDHAALASALAGHLARTSRSPAEDAATAGEEWGRSLAAGRPPGTSPLAARHAVVGLLGEIGFDPDADEHARDVRLRQCPILDVARRHPDVVCGVHSGLVTALLERLGAPDDARDAVLVPFAEPGACTLRLGRPGDPEDPASGERPPSGAGTAPQAAG